MPTARSWTRVAVGLAVGFAVLNTVNALNKGGDAAVFFEGGRRLLGAVPLYLGSSAADGFIGPPFQALFFAPFAAIAAATPVGAKLLWYAINLACLAVGIKLTFHSWSASRSGLGRPERAWIPTVLAPLLAVLLPLQTNFEHQNMSALLLALVAGATWHLVLGSALLAGILLGVATALKAFPALLIIYLAARRRWAACLAAIVTAIVLTVSPVFVYGAEGFGNLLKTFWRLSNSGWPVRGNNQSLIAAIDRYTSGFAAEGVRVAPDAPLAAMLYLICAILLVLAMIYFVRARPTQSGVPCEVAAVTTLAVLLSPIAWDHYWTLMFPAFFVLYECRATTVFWIAAVLTTGLSPLTLGRTGFDLARQLSASTIAALIVYFALVRIRGRMGKGI